MPVPAAAATPVEYVPGKQSVPGRRAVRIAANENPLPPLPSVIAAMAAALHGVNRYPEPRADGLRAAIAEYHAITPDMVTVGPGAGPITERAVLGRCAGRELLFAQPSFIAYQNHAAMAGATAVRVPLDPDHVHDLDAMLARIGPATGAVIVCNPNNPTGTAVGATRLRRFLDAVPPTCLVILDEAYADFAGEECARGLELIADFANLLVIRTFSKSHGLAGLRAGYAMAQPELIAEVDRARNLFQVNALAQLAAVASLQARDELDERIAATRTERAWVTEHLAGLGYEVTPSQANFVWLPMATEDGAAVTGYLEGQGVLVRHLGSGVRVSIGTREDNEALIAALGDYA